MASLFAQLAEYWEPKPKARRGDSRESELDEADGEEGEDELHEADGEEEEDDENMPHEPHEPGGEEEEDKDMPHEGESQQQPNKAVAPVQKAEDMPGQAKAEAAGSAAPACEVEETPELKSGITHDFAAMSLGSPATTTKPAATTQVAVLLIEDSPGKPQAVKKVQPDPSSTEAKRARLELLK